MSRSELNALAGMLSSKSSTPVKQVQDRSDRQARRARAVAGIAGALLLLWIVASWAQVISQNTRPDPTYWKWNIFTILVN